jgi:hypothetical protein
LRKRWCISIALFLTILICVGGIAFLNPKAPEIPLLIRLSGVAPNSAASARSVWRVDVPKPKSNLDAVLFWSVWIQQTNAERSDAQMLLMKTNENDLLNWPISGTESGIVTWSGPGIESNKIYRAIGALSEPGRSPWRARFFQTPLRPFLRFWPEPRPRLATSHWVRIKLPSASPVTAEAPQ